MSELGPYERHFVDALREADEPTSEDRERVRGKVLAEIALASAAGTAAAATTAKAATAGAAGAAGAAGGSMAGATAKSVGVGAFIAAQWKAGLTVLALGAAAGAGTWWVGSSSPAQSLEPEQTEVAPAAKTPQAGPARPANAEPDEASDSESPDESPDESEAEQQAEPSRNAQRRPAPPAVADVREPSLDREVQLLGEAQQAMKRGNPERALQLLDQHAAEHPSGVLSAERAGARAVALCKAGKLAEGRAAAQRFLAKQPNSPLAARIRAACLRPGDDD